MPGICIIGCGMIARFHVRALADIPNTKVVALVDNRPGIARKLSDDLGLGAGAYEDQAAALARPDVDVVIVATPSGAHMEPAVAAAAAGKHVVVEKPLEVTLE